MIYCWRICRKAIVVLVLILAELGPRYAIADDVRPAKLGGKYGISADWVAQTPPAGMELSGGAWYRYVYGTNASALWNGLYVEGGGLLSLNPAYGRLSAYVEWMPIAVVQLHAQVDRYTFLGQAGSLVSYPDRNASYGAGNTSSWSGREKTGDANRLLLQPTLQFAFGPYVVVNRTTYAYYAFAAEGGPYFWDQEYDTLLKKHDRLYADDLYILYDLSATEGDQKFLVGPAYGVVHAQGADLTRERLGINLYLELQPHSFLPRTVVRPRVYLQTGVNLRDRNLQGRAYVEGGIGADFDLD